MNQYNNGFTPRATAALGGAQLAAQQAGHTYIGTEHLFLALMREGAGAAYTLLSQRRVTAGKAERVLLQMVGRGHPTLLEAEETTAHYRAALEAAQREAQNGGFLQAGTEHLLLALCRQENSGALRLMAKLSVDVDNLTLALQETIRLEQCEQNVDRQPPKVMGKAARQTRSVMLDRFGRDLTELARQGRLDPVIGRERETERLLQILSRRSKNNPCLIGEAGVGKTAVVEGLAQRIAEGRVPLMLAEKRVITLDLPAMVAGTKYRGDFEERIRSVIEEVAAAGDVILFIDEIHTIMGIGAAEGAVDAANIMKPKLARGELQVIGATTIAEYRKTIEKDGALARRFQSLLVEEPTEAQTMEILRGLRPRYEQHHEMFITEGALEMAVRLSVRYFPTRFLPDKAIDLLDEAAARHRIERTGTLSAGLRPARRLTLTQREVQQAASAMTGLAAEQSLSAERLESGLRKSVVGQQEAVETVIHAILRSSAGLRDPRRPIGSFLFLGPSGVGKTQLCYALGKTLFGSEENIIKLDMSEYREPHSISRLIGAPPGYVGCEEGGVLTEAVKKHPMSVVVFDEIEKAHPDLYNLLLQIMEDGRLTDSQGRLAVFSNTVVILTSNLGAEAMMRRQSIGFGDGEEDKKAAVLAKLREHLRPELLGRLDETVLFQPLGREELRQIAGQLLGQVQGRLREQEIAMEFEDTLLEQIVQGVEEGPYGARPLRRLVRTMVEDPLTERLLAGELHAGDILSCGWQDNALQMHAPVTAVQ